MCCDCSLHCVTSGLMMVSVMTLLGNHLMHWITNNNCFVIGTCYLMYNVTLVGSCIKDK